MPKQKTPKGSKPSSADAEITDPRFSNFTTDPRFRLPSKKNTKTKLDKRFEGLLKDDDFSRSAKGKVDRYGRKLGTRENEKKKKEVLERLYVVDVDEDDGEEIEGEGEVEDDDVVEKELKRVEGKAYDPARGGGFSSSEDEDDDESEDEDDDLEDGGVQITEAEERFPDMHAEAAAAAVEMGEVTNRFAVVNLDWDFIRSVDLMAVFQSFVPAGGRIEKISVFASEFGKDRMEREELEGPPKEIFAKKDEDGDVEEEEEEEEEDEDEQEMEEKIRKDLQKGDDGQEFDGAALRQYQLERLRYYYAVVVSSDKDTAQKIYEATDGTEYLSSANFFDLRFIPDGVEFEDKPRDECESTPAGYRPTEFVTDALQHSKVKLTWDTNPEEAVRKDAIKRAFSGSRAELVENDLRAYLGSDSEDDEEEVETVEDAPKLSKKEIARQKMRAALGLTDEPTKPSQKSGPVGDMEITFTAGLSSKEKGSVFENEPETETTAERYIRLEKERKARRKERAKAKREGRNPDAEPEKEDESAEKQDLGFDDPFFATDEAVKEKAYKSLRKEERLKKRAAKAAEAAEKASNRAELELLMADNGTEPAAHLDHFDINEIARAEKGKKKKGKKAREVETGKRGGLQEGFEMDVGDSRFSKLFESHEFAIDPSNPKFKGTEGMKKLLEEGRKKKRGVEGDGGEDELVGGRKTKKRKVDGGEEERGELSGLVEKVKKKSKR